MKCIISVLLFMSFSASAMDCTRINQLSDYQKSSARFLYTYGQQHDISYTLMAISLAESSLGKWRVNYISNDFGLMQVNIRTASDTLGVTNHFRRLELAEKMIYDDSLNVYLAVRVLQHFNKGNWREMVMSYNEGYKWRRDKRSRQKAEKYLSSIVDNVKMFQQCNQWR